MGGVLDGVGSPNWREEMKKFKIGDLVQLSAAGKARHHNGIYNHDGAWGMVVKYIPSRQFPILCQWFGDDAHHRGRNNNATFKEYELKRRRK